MKYVEIYSCCRAGNRHEHVHAMLVAKVQRVCREKAVKSAKRQRLECFGATSKVDVASHLGGCVAGCLVSCLAADTKICRVVRAARCGGGGRSAILLP